MTCLISLLPAAERVYIYTARLRATLLRRFNLVTFTKFETLERFKLTQLFVYHVHGTNVTHCVDGKYGGLAAGTNMINIEKNKK